MDGSVFLYNIITGKKLKAYYHPNLLPINEVTSILTIDNNKHKPPRLPRNLLQQIRPNLLLQHKRPTNPTRALKIKLELPLPDPTQRFQWLLIFIIW